MTHRVTTKAGTVHFCWQTWIISCTMMPAPSFLEAVSCRWGFFSFFFLLLFKVSLISVGWMLCWHYQVWISAWEKKIKWKKLSKKKNNNSNTYLWRSGVPAPRNSALAIGAALPGHWGSKPGGLFVSLVLYALTIKLLIAELDGRARTDSVSLATTRGSPIDRPPTDIQWLLISWRHWRINSRGHRLSHWNDLCFDGTQLRR